MTVEATVSKIIYTGDNSTTVFPYPFKIYADDNLVVTEIVIATGVRTVKTLTTHYTVSGAGVATGGNVTMLTAPASTVKIAIQRELDLKQELDLVENDAAPSSTREDALDKIVMMIQQLEEKLNRAFLRDVTQVGEIITDLDATWYYLRGIDLTNAILTEDLDLSGYKIYNITGIWDDDKDTGVQVEESSDEDKVRIDTGGTQRVLVNGNGVKLQSGADVNEFSIDGNLVGNSDDAVPTEKAVKTYADAVGTNADTNANTKISKTIAAEINAMTEKTTLVDNDLFLIEDSAASNAKKKAKFSNILPSVVLKKQVFTSNGTFTAPTGVTKVYITLQAGGGGGGGGRDTNQAGGGGGAAGRHILRYPYTVTPASGYAVVIGAAGAAGTHGDPGTNGGTGGDSSFDSTVVVKGGTGGDKGTSGTAGSGGVLAATSYDGEDGVQLVAAGANTILDVTKNGGDGGDGDGTYGGAGGSSPFGLGADGGDTGDFGAAASANTGAGGGGASGINDNGGAGGTGIALIEW